LADNNPAPAGTAPEAPLTRQNAALHLAPIRSSAERDAIYQGLKTSSFREPTGSPVGGRSSADAGEPPPQPSTDNQQELDPGPEEPGGEVEQEQPSPEQKPEPTLPPPETVIFHDDDGKPVTIAEARQRQLLHADYTRKRQADAEFRREVEGQRQHLLQYAEFAARTQAELAQTRQAQIPPPPDPSLEHTDPQRYQIALARHVQGQLQAQQAQREAELHRQAHERLMSEREEVRQREERDQLLTKIPEWIDPQVAQREWQHVLNYAQEVGYSEQDLARIGHREVIVLRDAARGRDPQKWLATQGKTAVRAHARSIPTGVQQIGPASGGRQAGTLVEPQEQRRQREETYRRMQDPSRRIRDAAAASMLRPLGG
jgi:hypothetical protein